ncbi:MAG TPA: hypothetical protein VN854_00965 [Mycoplasmatales bacterium]|nr:hypothetical protein [Mycoplasmatales bacterium]
MVTELIQREIIEGLTKRVKEQTLKTLKSESSTYVTNYRFPILKAPYCSDATSLSRLISYDQVCGCIYIDISDKNSVNLSTNYHPNDKSKTNIKRMKEDRFEKFIKPRLRNLINKGFKEKEKIELFQAAFDHMISENAKRFQPIIDDVIRKNRERYGSNDDHEIIVARLINNEIYRKSDWKDKSLKDIKEIHQGINSFLKEFDHGTRPYENRLYVSVMKIAIIFDDIERMCNLYNNEILCKAIANDKIKRAECRGSVGIHCEQRMFEHISNRYGNGHISKEVFEKLKEAVENKNFTVSKFCCWYCYLVFRKLSNVLGGNEDSLNKLGHSCCFFPGWKSPSFENDEIFKQIKYEIETEISKEVNFTGKFENFIKSLIISNEYMIIENSEVANFIN